MLNSLVFVSFVTKNSPYIEIMEKYLIPSLKKFNLSYDIDYIKDKGSWLKNVRYKSEFIKKMLLKHKQAIVSLDADSEIIQYPILFDKLEQYDMSFHYLDWYRYWRNKKGKSQRIALGGTIYFNYNKNVLTFVDEWIKQQKRTNNYAQTDMQKISEKFKTILKIYDLPIEYCVIIKRNNTVPSYVKNIVIKQYQLSRKIKK